MSENEPDLRALLETATPGPWSVLPDDENRPRILRANAGAGPTIADPIRLGYEETSANVALIAALRNEAAALLDDRDRLRALEAGLESAMKMFAGEMSAAAYLTLSALLATRPDAGA